MQLAGMLRQIKLLIVLPEKWIFQVIIKEPDPIIFFCPACFYFILIRNIYFILIIKIYFCNNICVRSRINIFRHFTVVIQDFCPAADKDISLFHFHICGHKRCSCPRHHESNDTVFFCNDIFRRVILCLVFLLRQQIFLKFHRHFRAVDFYRSPDNFTVCRTQFFFQFFTVDISFWHTEACIFVLQKREDCLL